jgi:hypothetical protein
MVSMGLRESADRLRFMWLCKHGFKGTLASEGHVLHTYNSYFQQKVCSYLPSLPT